MMSRLHAAHINQSGCSCAGSNPIVLLSSCSGRYGSMKKLKVYRGIYIKTAPSHHFFIALYSSSTLVWSVTSRQPDGLNCRSPYWRSPS